MGLFDKFKKNKKTFLDCSIILNDNDVEKYLKLGQLKWICILSPVFGGVEDRSNQILVTSEAEQEKQLIDEELINFLKQGKSVKKLNMNFEYKKNSLVVSKLFISAIVDGKNYKKVINVW